MNTAEAPNTAGLMIPVRWAGADDFGGAGLRSYNVDVREGTGEWSRWLSETMQTQADFAGEDGKQYTFRVQGVDRVGNAGAWLETATAATYAVTKYYAMAGHRVAMRQGSAVSYLYGDHLGSTSLITDASGAAVTETRYQPYGQPYWQWGATRTDYGFTGQRLDGFGLMDYNARYYSSTLGRFISPDSIIPQPGSPLAWERYAYVNSNPVRYTDPSGNTPLIVTALLGAVISFGASYAVQTLHNINEGAKLSEAVKWSNMDRQALTVAAVGGFVSGLTMGASSLLIGGTQGLTLAGEVLYSTVSGAVSNAAAGQVEAFTNAVYDNFEDSKTLISTSDGNHVIHFDPNFEGFWDEAADYGFGDLRVIGNDALSGAFVGGLTSVVNNAIKDLGTPDISFLWVEPSPLIRPFSKLVDYFGELLLQQ